MKKCYLGSYNLKMQVRESRGYLEAHIQPLLLSYTPG